MTLEITCTALGLTGSGKTCFTTTMYNGMQIGIKNGYKLTSKDHGRHDLDVAFDKMKNEPELGQNRFPLGTSRGEKYHFMLNHGLTDKCKINWFDYEGGLLSSKPEGSSEYELLRMQINASDSLMIFVDCEKIVNTQNNEERIDIVKEDCADDIIDYLDEYHDNNNKLPVTIVIMLSKYDLIKEKINDDHDMMREVIMQAFIPLFTEAQSEENDISIFLVPTSLGDHIEDEDKKGPLEPYNMELPVMLTYFEAIDRLIKDADKGVLARKFMTNISVDDVEREIEETKNKIEEENKKIRLRQLPIKKLQLKDRLKDLIQFEEYEKNYRPYFEEYDKVFPMVEHCGIGLYKTGEWHDKIVHRQG